ncbi:MAG: hypothetical protein A2041_06350 [Bacteroidetes bacterium GWA2_31_9b]|nr:MAG: hypothetical protein A2041_06350 [Bacteroidetes bacterium GWA2_31_9b]
MLRKILIINLLLLISFSTFAQLEKVQAAFIYNFTKYLEWPAEYSSGDFVIGVINSPEMLSKLNAMVAAGKLVGTQKIIIKSYSSINEVSNCHLVYLPSNLSGKLAELISIIKGKSTIIVTSGNGLAQIGSDFNFIILGDKQNFEINKTNIKSKNIVLSSKLEQLAVKVY